MRILAIETSCDETALALVEATNPSTGSGSEKSLPKFKVLREAVASQIKIHRPFGGVVPMLAKREHLKNLPILYRQIFGEGHIAYSKKQMAGDKGHIECGKKIKSHKLLAISQVDLIAVTVGPGLEPALWAGITFAQELAKKYKKLLLGVNHLEGHLYSFLLPPTTYHLRPTDIFPAIALIVSGGHTLLLRMDDLKSWKKLGETRDDAVGEAFDKVARLLSLPYPGGPEIEKLAATVPKSWSDHINFPRPMFNTKDYDFSFSGLKTSVLYYLRDHPFDKLPSIRLGTGRAGKERAKVAKAFSNAAIDVLVRKTMRAARETGARSILLSGGVAANKSLRQTFQKEAKKLGVNFLVAEQKYNTDNAVMIAAAGYMQTLRKKKRKLEAKGDLGI